MRKYIWMCLVMLVFVRGSAGQQISPAGELDDPLGPPTQRGTRMTPGMARAMGQLFSRNVLVSHYGMDAEKTNQAAELVARRIMSVAHSVDAHGAALAERLITEMCEASARGAHAPSDMFSSELQQDMAEQILPSLPAVRDLLAGVAGDVGPMLSFKQQLRMAGELTMVNSGVDAFEKRMQRWARGEGRPGENPFRDAPAGEEEPLERDASGQSVALKSAREAADKELDKQEWVRRIWDNYLNEFKSFYGLDESQCAAADSLLRDYLERAQVIMQDRSWQDQIYRSRLWLQMSGQLRMEGVFRNILNSRYEEAMAPINALGDEFRLRLEQIPTDSQKMAAEARITAALKERGYEQGDN